MAFVKHLTFLIEQGCVFVGEYRSQYRANNRAHIGYEKLQCKCNESSIAVWQKSCHSLCYHNTFFLYPMQFSRHVFLVCSFFQCEEKLFSDSECRRIKIKYNTTRIYVAHKCFITSRVSSKLDMIFFETWLSDQNKYITDKRII